MDIIKQVAQNVEIVFRSVVITSVFAHRSCYNGVPSVPFLIWCLGPKENLTAMLDCQFQMRELKWIDWEWMRVAE